MPQILSPCVGFYSCHIISSIACYILLSAPLIPHHGEVNCRGEVSAAPNIHKTTASSHPKGYSQPCLGSQAVGTWESL